MQTGTRQRQGRSGRRSPSSKSSKQLNPSTTPLPEKTSKQGGRECEVCGDDISGRRADAKTCSTACRVALSVRSRSRSEAINLAENETLSPTGPDAKCTSPKTKMLRIRWAFISEPPQVTKVEK